MKKITIIVKSNNRERIEELVKSVAEEINSKNLSGYYMDSVYWPIKDYVVDYAWEIEDYDDKETNRHGKLPEELQQAYDNIDKEHK